MGLGRRLEHQAKEVGEMRRQVDRLGEEVEHHVEEQMVHPPEQPLQDPAVVPGEVEVVLREEVEVALPRGWRRGWRVTRACRVVLGPGEAVPRGWRRGWRVARTCRVVLRPGEAVPRRQGGGGGGSPPGARRESTEGRRWPAAKRAATVAEIDAFLASAGLPVRTVGVTEGDGNCWYRALATQVCSWGFLL